MLLISSSVRMVDGVHRHTSNSWPTLPLCLVFVELVSSLANWLVGPSSPGNNAHHGSAVAWDGSPGSTGESDSSLGSVLGVPNDNSGGAGGSSKGSSIPSFGFTVGDYGSFWELVHWQYISHSQGGY